MSEPGKRSKHFWVRSMYGANTQKPIVVLTLPGGESVQMEPADARNLALNLLQGAEAAEQDAWLVEWLKESLKADEQQTVVILREYRQWREKREAEGK